MRKEEQSFYCLKWLWGSFFPAAVIEQKKELLFQVWLRSYPESSRYAVWPPTSMEAGAPQSEISCVSYSE